MPIRAFRLFLFATFAATCVALYSGTAAAQTTNASTPVGNAARGKTVFLNFGCYECHGTVGQGNFTTAPHPLPYVALVSYIRKPAGAMPSYAASILSDRDAADIYAYLTSIPSGKAPAQIPLLSSTTLKPN
jgi:mono/diheme cytochrome c family protein